MAIPEYKRIIAVDVPRSRFFRECHDFDAAKTVAFDDELTRLLEGAVEESDAVNYYQGLASIAAAMLLAEGRVNAAGFLRRFLACHGSFYCAPTIEQTQAVLGLLAHLLEALDPELATAMHADGILAQHSHAMAGIMTWRAHGSASAEEAAGWLRALSGRHPLAVVYAAAASTIARRAAILGAMRSSPGHMDGTVFALLREQAPGDTVEASMRVVDGLMERIQPRVLVLSAPGNVREALSEFPAAWMRAGDVPEIWADGTASARGDAAPAKAADRGSPAEIEAAKAAAREAALPAPELHRIAEALGSGRSPEAAGPSMSASLTRAALVLGVVVVAAVAVHLVAEACSQRSPIAEHAGRALGGGPVAERGALAWAAEGAASSMSALLSWAS